MIYNDILAPSPRPWPHAGDPWTDASRAHRIYRSSRLLYKVEGNTGRSFSPGSIYLSSMSVCHRLLLLAAREQWGASGRSFRRGAAVAHLTMRKSPRPRSRRGRQRLGRIAAFGAAALGMIVAAVEAGVRWRAMSHGHSSVFPHVDCVVWYSTITIYVAVKGPPNQADARREGGSRSGHPPR